MLPGFYPGSIVVGLSLRHMLGLGLRRPRIGDVVIVRHGQREKIKRLAKLAGDGRAYVLGDNPPASTDSRQFGWLQQHEIRALVVWPRPEKPEA